MKIKKWACVCRVGHYYDTRVCWNCGYDRLKIKAEDTVIKDLEAKLKIAVDCVSDFQNKTDIYLKIYPDDKELRKHKSNASEFLEKIKAGDGK